MRCPEEYTLESATIAQAALWKRCIPLQAADNVDAEALCEQFQYGEHHSEEVELDDAKHVTASVDEVFQVAPEIICDYCYRIVFVHFNDDGGPRQCEGRDEACQRDGVENGCDDNECLSFVHCGSFIRCCISFSWCRVKKSILKPTVFKVLQYLNVQGRL